MGGCLLGLLWLVYRWIRPRKKVLGVDFDYKEGVRDRGSISEKRGG